MRAAARGARGRAAKRLIIVAVFSASVLAVFLFNRTTPLVSHGSTRAKKMTAEHIAQHSRGTSTGTSATARQLHIGNAAQQDSLHHMTEHVSVNKAEKGAKTPAPSGPQAAATAPPPLEVLSQTDARHPKNIRAMISGQSNKDEEHANMVNDMIKGKFVTTEIQKAGARQTARQNTTQSSTARQAQEKTSVGGAAGDKKGHASTHNAVVDSGVHIEGGGLETHDVKATVAKTQFDMKGAQKSGGREAGAGGQGAGAGGQGPGKSGAAASVSKGQNKPDSTAPGPGCKAAGQGCGLPGNTIHTLFTSNGSPYQNIQARIMIGTWHIVRAQPGGSHMVAMSRVLHRMTPDELMEEVDTFRADPLQPECDTWCWFPVADRANAFQQWLDAVAVNPSMQKAPWLLLLETDYVWIKPLPSPGDAYDRRVPGMSFAFDYIGPKNNIWVERMLKEECPTCDPDTVPNSGPAPVLARYEDFVAATPLWERLSKWIEENKEAKKALGWVREMYAWDIGVAAGRLNIKNEGPPETLLIAQPPHDTVPNNATMYHYTWGSIFKNEKDEKIWMFDKRVYVDPKDAYKLPRMPLPPPWREGIHLQDGVPVSKDIHKTLTHMLTLMNEAIDRLPDLTEHAAKLKQQLEAQKAAGAKTGTARR